MIKKIIKEVSLIVMLSLVIVILSIGALQAINMLTNKDKSRSDFQKEIMQKDKVEISKEPTVIIPSLEVRVPIVFSTSNEEKLIIEDLRKGLSHRLGTANPGEKGNVFLAGHSSNYPWERGDYNQVFNSLGKLEKDDVIYVDYGGKRYTYVVTEKQVVETTDISVMDATQDYRMSIMTCYPPGTLLKRLIIISELKK